MSKDMFAFSIFNIQIELENFLRMRYNKLSKSDIIYQFLSVMNIVGVIAGFYNKIKRFSPNIKKMCIG